MTFKILPWVVGSLCVVATIGCGSPKQPKSDHYAIVELNSEPMADVKLNLHQQVSGSWQVVLSGTSQSTGPFPLYPPPESTHKLEPAAEIRASLESVGGTPVPFSPMVQSPNESDIRVVLPATPQETIRVTLDPNKHLLNP